MIETRPKTKKKQKSEGCHCSDPKPDGTCCNLVCFERPNYFCGHLLTDADLSKEQQYVVEKNKLYNRTLHGWGIVCGLRLTCGDDECCGAIVIDEGYAIDDCGNDLVVCEPRRFDVVSLLKEKGLIVGDAIYDPCLPEDEEDECEYTQCFYVTACYEEEASDFTTPFVAGCRPTLTECEPTRIREGVRFDVVDELPEESSWLEELFERLTGCFSVFTNGQFSKALNNAENRRRLEAVCSNPDNVGRDAFDGLKDLFYELRGLLLLYFQKHRDKYNCKLADEIRRNTFPDDPTGPKIKDAFSSLLRVAFNHAISCALGELVPRCPSPKKAGCVVLGTVEVRGGCVTHVCNCPRKYVWSFANFFQVLLASLYGDVACEEKQERAAPVMAEDRPAGAGRIVVNNPEKNGHNGRKRHVCCAEFDATCEDILPLLDINPKFLQYAGTEAVRSFQVLTKSVRSIFNFTDARMFSPSMFINMKQPAMERAIADLKIKNFRNEQVAVPPGPAHPIEEFARMGLGLRSESRLVFQRDPDNVVVNAYIEPDFLQAQAPRQETGSRNLEGRVTKAESEARAAAERAARLEERLAATEEFIRNVTSAGGIKTDVQRRIEEQLASSEAAESTQVKRRTTKKATKGGQPPTPEGEGGENG